MQRKDIGKSSKPGHELSGTSQDNGDGSSVHKKNLYLFSLPLIFVFAAFRQLLYHLFVFFKTVGSLVGKARFIFVRKTDPPNPTRLVVAEKPTTEVNHPEMSHRHQTGPADPLLQRQKHHHRRAFECISKALKIDEENEGKSTLLKLSNKFLVHL